MGLINKIPSYVAVGLAPTYTASSDSQATPVESSRTNRSYPETKKKMNFE